MKQEKLLMQINSGYLQKHSPNVRMRPQKKEFIFSKFRDSFSICLLSFSMNCLLNLVQRSGKICSDTSQAPDGDVQLWSILCHLSTRCSWSTQIKSTFVLPSWTELSLGQLELQMTFWFGSFSGTATPGLGRIEGLCIRRGHCGTKPKGQGSFLRMGVGDQQFTCHQKLGGTSQTINTTEKWGEAQCIH